MVWAVSLLSNDLRATRLFAFPSNFKIVNLFHSKFYWFQRDFWSPLRQWALYLNNFDENTRYLNSFRRKPAITKFDLPITATLKSSKSFATDIGSALQFKPSACSRVNHLVSGLNYITFCPFRLNFFAPTFPLSLLYN